MELIKDMTEQIRDELKGAKEYAVLASSMKAENPSAAQMYAKMAQDELGHATQIHGEAVKAIEKQKAIAEPPTIMKKLWAIEHKYYVEHAAATKAMLELYAK